MKIRISNHLKEAGSTLTVVIILSALIVVSLLAYLNLLKNTNYSTVRSQVWNDAMPVVEAGIEDALTHLNVWGQTNLNRDGWTGVTANMFRKQGMVGNSTYLVIISNYVVGSVTNRPMIESRAWVPLPLNYASGQPDYFFAAAGGGNPQKKYIARGVRTPAMLKNGLRGLVMKSTIQLQGNPGSGTLVDSYDSSNPSYSTGGKYDAAKAKQNGMIGSNSRNSGTVQVQGNTKVVGTVATGASGVLTMATPAVVGDLPYVNNPANGGKVKAGHLLTSLNVPFPNVSAPFAGGGLNPNLPGGTIGGVAYNHILPAGNYQTASYLMGAKKVYVSGNAVLYITGDFKMAGAQIDIAPGAKLDVYLNGPFEATGASKINVNGVPSQFSLNGMPNHKSAQVKNDSQLVGTFYCPNADAQFVDNTVLCGAAMFNNLQAQHQFKFHYDEALMGGSDNPLYFITGWSEMTPTEVAALPQGVYVTLP